VSLPVGGVLALRRRTPWEAADAGLLLWRDSFFYFLPFFAVPYWTFAFALRLLPGRFQTVPAIILWLFLPLFDRLILHVISVRFFEKGAGLDRIRRGLGRSLVKGLAGDLLWRRFSPLRAAMLPVRVLENLPRRKIPFRRQTLRKGGLGFCFLLTVWGVALEIVMACGEIIFCFIMLFFIEARDFSYTEFVSNAGLLFYTLHCVNVILVETLYICMGFGLYLNSRVEVEGWDIEIKFREFAARHNAGTGINNINKMIILVTILFVGLVASTPVHCLAAGDSPDAGMLTVNGTETVDNGLFTGAEAPLETLQTVLDSPDFGGQRDGWGIRLKNPMQPKAPPQADVSPWQEIIRRVLAVTLRVILIAVMAAAAAFLVFYLYKLGRERIPLRDGKTIQGLPETAQESPGFLLEQARRSFEQGDTRRAWGLCTAAAIRSWAVYRDFAFPSGATEYDCVAIVSRQEGGAAAAFAELVKHWVHFAYGGRVPPEGSFEKAIVYCESLGPVDES
jgi:hypothetical protein